MKRTLLLLLYALLFSVSAVADPGDDDINPGNPNTNLPGSGTVEFDGEVVLYAWHKDTHL